MRKPSLKVKIPKVFSSGGESSHGYPTIIKTQLSADLCTRPSPKSYHYLSTADCTKLCFFGVEKMDALLAEINEDLGKVIKI